MRALTLTQPWATLVAIGAKKIETRSWSTGYRGPIAIHAAKGFPRWAQEECVREPFNIVLAKDSAGMNPIGLPRGAVLAVARLVDVVPTESMSVAGLAERERRFGDYSPGRFAWMLENVQRLKNPIPTRGALGLWEWEEAA